MSFAKRLSIPCLSIITAATMLNFAAAEAQQMTSQVAMTLLPVTHENGHDFIVTPNGFKVQVPGTGIGEKASAVAVYQDAAKNYWYINKSGVPTQVNPQVIESVRQQVMLQMQVRGLSGVPGAAPGLAGASATVAPNAAEFGAAGSGNPQEMQARLAALRSRFQGQAFASGQAPTGMPAGQYPSVAPQMVPPGSYAPPYQAAAPAQVPPTQQTTIVEQPSSNNSGSAALAAAGMGTATGLAIGALAASGSSGYGSYYGVPYGHPIYAAPHNQYYYNNNGNKAYVAPNSYNKQYFDQYKKQGAWNDRGNWGKNLNANNVQNRHQRRVGRR